MLITRHCITDGSRSRHNDLLDPDITWGIATRSAAVKINQLE